MMRSCLFGTVITLTLLLPAHARPAGFGDYKHDFLLAEETSDRVRFFGAITGSFDVESLADAAGDSAATSWKNSFGNRSTGTVWVAGSPSPRVQYFVEGIYHLQSGEFESGQIRGDYSIVDRALAFRFGQFHFPFGIEMRGAPTRINRFLSRPGSKSEIVSAIGIYGDLFDQNLNYFAAAANESPGSPTEAASVEKRANLNETGVDSNNSKAVGGRIGYSPRAGLEIGGSLAWDRFDDSGDQVSILLGGDFSLNDGPLHLQAEGTRRRVDVVTGEQFSTSFYGRIAYKIVEDSEHFDYIDILAGVELIDPDSDSPNDRVTTFSGGLAISPANGVVLRGEYQARREQTNDIDDDRVLLEGLLFW